MFDWEHGIALQPMPGNQASSHGEREVSRFSRVVAGTWGIFSIYGRDGHSKLEFVQRLQDACLVTTDTSEI